MLQPPAEFESNFATAGWSGAWRHLPDDQIPLGHPAHEVLTRFGGLHVYPSCDTGIECATSDIEFAFLTAQEPAAEWEPQLKVQLVGIAHTFGTYQQLWLSNDNRYFATDDMTDTFAFVADNFQDAVRHCLAGLRMRPLLPASDSSVMIYGETMTDGDSRLYDWTTSARFRDRG